MDEVTVSSKLLKHQRITSSKLLRPFEEINQNCKFCNFCIFEVISHVSVLEKYLDKNENTQRTPGLDRMWASLKAELESHFKPLEEN